MIISIVIIFVLTAINYQNIPSSINNISLSAYEQSLSDEQKIEYARQIVHNKAYYIEKESIYTNLNSCINNLETEMQKVQAEIDDIKNFISLVR